ncbi:MAG: DUF933 domain-containing protein [Candidatus Omnitrophota bacterium]
MKIGIIGFSPEKDKITFKDSRLDKLEEFYKAKKKTYITISLIKDNLIEADGIVCLESEKLELIFKDLELTEKYIESQPEKRELFIKLKEGLEKEKFISELDLSEEDRQFLANMNLLSLKPVYLLKEQENFSKEIGEIIASCGYISYFTAGEKEARAWLIKKGVTAPLAAGIIHSDIERGFIKAEVVNWPDIEKATTVHDLKPVMRLEGKEYIVCDGDSLIFRFNK